MTLTLDRPVARPEAAALRRCVPELAAVPGLPAPTAGALDGCRAVVLGGDAEGRAALDTAADTAADTATDVGAALSPLGAVDVVVDLNVPPMEPVSAGAWAAPLAQSYQVLRAVAPDWRRERRADRCSYLALTALGGRLGSEPAAIRQPLGGIWAGLAKTLPRELPACTARVVDVDDEDPGAAVVAELVGGRFTEVGWYAGGRHVLLPRPGRSGTPNAHLDSSAAVLLTGGGRGIGYHLARRVRATVGCRVVVTGRLDLDAYPEDLLQAGEEAFAQRRRQLLRGARGAEALRDARAELDRLARARELAANLEAARRAGEELDYRRCDVTDADAVAALLAGIREPLAAVVHDAGIDHPARLGAKTDADVRAVVSVKVDGFLHLLGALERRRVGAVCAVGSLTGRFGGTAGQTDYAGANEGLARLAGWAGARRAEPVSSLSWPTWESVGLITNYRAAVREMTAVPVAAGVDAWAAELAEPAAGEVLFLAEVGALAPAQLTGLPVPSDYDGARDILGRRHRLGRVTGWVPAEELASTHLLRRAELPAAEGFVVAGRPAVPVSVLLELMLDAAGWLLDAPAGVLRDLRVRPASLVLPDDGRLELGRGARARRTPGGTVVDVELRSGSGAPAATGTLAGTTTGTTAGTTAGSTAGTAPVRRPADRAPVAAVELPERGGEIAWTAAPGLIRRCRDAAGWQVTAERRRAGEVYADPAAADPVLPAGLLEALLWASCPPGAGASSVLAVDEVRLGPGDRDRCGTGFVEGGTAGGWDDDGRAVLVVTGLRWLEGGAR